MEEIESFIQEAVGLRNEAHNSPRFHLWRNRVNQFVQNSFGDRYLEIFEKALRWDRIPFPEEVQEMHYEAVNRAIEFLNALKNEPKKPNGDFSSRETNEISVKRVKPEHFGGVTISGGNVFFGDGNTLSQIYVKDVIDAISKEIEQQSPASVEKSSILESLNKLTTNETFASVTGAFVGEILKSMLR